MADKIVVQRSGIGLAPLLTVLFVGLKLTGVIAWSWWWVLSPLWLPLVALLGVILLIALITGSVGLIVTALERRK